MRWNVLNLLDSAGVHGSSLKYSWLSDGTKVASVQDDGNGNVLKRHYVGSFVFVEDPEGNLPEVPPWAMRVILEEDQLSTIG